jgi:Na+/proline symporter
MTLLISMSFDYVDIYIVVGYLLLMLGVAFFFRRFAHVNMENFFLGGRKVPGWLNGISYTAALISPDAATAYGGLAVVTGSFICWWYLCRFGLALLLGGILFAVFWRKLNLFTSLEFYELRFPKRPASVMRLWIAVRTSMIAMPAWTGITLLAAYKIMMPVFGWTRVETLLFVVPISFLYVFFSGYRGVVVSNFIQMAIFFIGALTLACLTLSHFGGPTAMAATLHQQFPTKASKIFASIPPARDKVFPMVAALAWLFGQSIGYGGDAAPMGGAMEGQRILSSRTPAEAMVMYFTTAITMFIILLLITLPCISAAALWPDLRLAGATRELVYGRLMKKLLPVGAMGLMVAAMLAATMSTVSDNLNFGGQVLVNDIYRRWFIHEKKEKHYLIAGKIGMALILVMAIVVVFKVSFVIDVAIFMLQLSAAELPANWAQWWWWRFNGPARIAASFGGAAIFCVVVLLPKGLSWMHVSWADSLLLPWWWQTLLVMGLTTVLWVTVALLTKPDPEELLDEFYRRVKPFGWWGPYKHLGRTTPSYERLPIAKGIGIAIIGFIATSLLILGLTKLWFGAYVWCIAELGIAALLFYMFRILTKKYLRMLSTHTNDRDDLPQTTAALCKE